MDRYLGLFLLLSVSHGTSLEPEVKAKVQSFIKASMECHHIPGMTLSIVEGKIIRINQGFEGGVEKSVQRITVWHHEACR